MLEQYLEQLNSPDSAKRREAVIWIGRNGDPRALKHLAVVFKTDPDPAIRDLAGKAGRHIQNLQKQASTNSSGNVPPSQSIVPPSAAVPEAEYEESEPEPDSLYIEPEPESRLPDILRAYTKPDSRPSGSGGDENPNRMPDILAAYTKPSTSSETAVQPASAPGAVPTEVPKVRGISEAKRNQARARLNSAFNYKTNGDDNNALADLAIAVKLDPSLAENQGAQNLAVALVGGTTKDAIKLVIQKSQEAGAIKKRGPAYDSEIWDMVISLVVLFGVIALFSVALFYGLIIVSGALAPMLLRGRASDMSEFSRLFIEIPLKDVIGPILRLAAMTVGATFFQMVVTYGVGTMMMGGTGSFVRYLRVMMNVISLTYIVISVGFGLMIAAAVSGSRTQFETLGGIGALAIVGGLLGGLILEAWLTSRIHEFSIFKGFGAVMVGSSLSGFIAGALGMFNVNDPDQIQINLTISIPLWHWLKARRSKTQSELPLWDSVIVPQPAGENHAKTLENH